MLLAIDLDRPDSRAASYAVQLAARLKLSLVLMAVFPARGGDPADPGDISLGGLAEEQSLWLGKVRERCQQEGVNLEIFLAAGAFCDEVLAFARAQSALQFIVMGWPEDGPPGTVPRVRRGFKKPAPAHRGGNSPGARPGKSDPIDGPLRRVLGAGFGFWVRKSHE